MRVRPKRQAEPRRTLIPRRGWTDTATERQAPSPQARRDPAAPAAQPAPAPNAELRAERRMRASGGPEDHALYRCQCGFAFEAAVSTTVACPHCGSGQAW